MPSSIKNDAIALYAFREALDVIPSAVLLVTQEAELFYKNKSAADILERIRSIVVEDGRLSLRRYAEDNELRNTLHNLHHEEAALLCLRNREGISVITLDLRRMHKSRFVMIHITDLVGSTTAPAKRLLSIFDFTPAESQVAAAFLTGQDLQEIAKARAVGIETIRSQVKMIQAKTGTNSQSQLARTLLRAHALP